jgi:hypothetical protein
LGQSLLEGLQFEDDYATWQEEYWARPAEFVRDCIQFDPGDGLTPYQETALQELGKGGRICVRSLHGAGKTAMAAWVVLWFSLTRDGRDWKVPTTATAWRQLTKYLWPEIHKWGRRVRWEVVRREPFREKAEMLDLSLKLRTGEAFALASTDPNAIEGAHATHLLYLFDEAKAIPDVIWDAAEGAFATTVKGEALGLAISTPALPAGRFYEIQKRKPGYEDWWVAHWTLPEVVAAERVDPDWAEQRRIQWGERSAVYQNRILGEFAVQEEAAIIPLSWVELAIERWRDWDRGGRVTALGVDVGGGLESGDASTIAICHDWLRIAEVRKYEMAVDPAQATMELAGLVGGILRAKGGVAYVDALGIGAGVLHRLRELGLRAEGFVASRKTGYKDQSGELGFANWRAAGWWLLREMLDPRSEFEVYLPDDPELIGDLTAPQLKAINSASQILVESKDDVIARLGRSPDVGDAVIHALVGPHLIRELSQSEEVVFQTTQIGERF